MAIWQPTEGSTPTFGAEGGEVWARGSGSNTLQAAPRSANDEDRRQFNQWPSGGDWQAVWEGLDEGTKAAWAAYAAGRPLTGFFGRPTVRTAAEAFALYQRTQTTLTGATPSPPYTVPGETSYAEERQPFEEWMDPEANFAIVTRVASAEARDFFFASARPVRGRAALNRARTRPVGTFHLAAGDAGRRWHAPTNAARALDGAAAWTEANELWLMAWEVSQGWPRAVLDPCHTPPPGNVPRTLTVRVRYDGGRPERWEVTREGNLWVWSRPDNNAWVYAIGDNPEGEGWMARGTTYQPTFAQPKGTKGPSLDPRGSYTPENPQTNFLIVE